MKKLGFKVLSPVLTLTMLLGMLVTVLPVSTVAVTGGEGDDSRCFRA